ncbi:MAG: zinc ribbon domain-containing protein [Deltaproteobacteria bacterium]|nr:zinc ribbon domain-containing protein [Deltaproteobacteria bacterium]
MPTYDYECTACKHKFEKFQSITAKSIRKCPACKKLKVKRLIGTGAGIIFKGSGFYQTDYRSSSYQEAAKKDSEKSSVEKAGKYDSKAAAKSTSESTTTTPAKKTETKPAKKSK